MIENNLTFTANCVKFSPGGDGSTSSVYFGEGDSGQDGHAWTFSHSHNDDDWGIRIFWGQQDSFEGYDCMEECILSRSRLECVFSETGTTQTGINTLTILYDISDESWRGLVYTAQRVFSGSLKLID
jgi:hypothetical protein